MDEAAVWREAKQNQRLRQKERESKKGFSLMLVAFVLLFQSFLRLNYTPCLWDL